MALYTCECGHTDRRPKFFEDGCPQCGGKFTDTTKVSRSAKTGRFVDKEKAKTSPSTTVTETVKGRSGA